MTKLKFTLLELLVVVAIIGILMSILLPSLRKARDASKRAVCASNESNVGHATYMFCADSDGKMPAANWVTMFGNGNNRPLNPYLESPEVAHCPADTGQTNGFQNISSNYNSWLGSSYSTPGRDVFGTERVIKMLAGASDLYIDHFEDPTKKMLTGDAVWLGNCSMNEIRHHWHSPDRRVNLLFIDGHVSFFKLPTILPNNHSRTPDNGWY